MVGVGWMNGGAVWVYVADRCMHRVPMCRGQRRMSGVSLCVTLPLGAWSLAGGCWSLLPHSSNSTDVHVCIVSPQSEWHLTASTGGVGAHLHCGLLLSPTLAVRTILTAVRWNVSVLIYISLMVSEGEHVFPVLLEIVVPVTFDNSLFIYWVGHMSSWMLWVFSCILDINPLSYI